MNTKKKPLVKKARDAAEKLRDYLDEVCVTIEEDLESVPSDLTQRLLVAIGRARDVTEAAFKPVDEALDQIVAERHKHRGAGRRMFTLMAGSDLPTTRWELEQQGF